MGLTYTTRSARGRWHRRLDASAWRGQLALLVTTAVSILAIVLCYAGRMQAFDTLERQRQTPPPMIVTDVTEAALLERALVPVFEHDADRRFAARELLRFLQAERERGPLTHVGALSRIEVAAPTIDSSRDVTVWPERLQNARARPLVAGSAPPSAVALLSGSDLNALKPQLVVRSRQAHRSRVFWSAAMLLLAFQIVSLVWRIRGLPGDRLLLAAAQLLTTLGFVVVLSRPDPLRDTLLVTRYTQGVVLGLAGCLLASLVRVRTSPFLQWGYVSLLGAVLLSLVLMVFGSGPGGSGAKVNLGPVQPIEVIRLLLVVFLAAYFGRRWELVRQLRETAMRGYPVPRWLDIPRLDYLLPVSIGVGLSLAVFFVLRDLGPALLISVIFLAMLSVARGRAGLVAGGFALLAGGFYLGHRLNISSTLAARVEMWRSPWDNAVRGGDQIAQAMWTIAAGAFGGSGLGLGDTRYLPAGYTDLVLASVGEELGLVGVITAAVAFAVIAWRGIRIARRAPSDTAVFLGLAMTLSLVVPAVVMAAGTLGLIPLTGVVTPFVSYGGSAMVVNFIALGFLAAIASDSDGVADSTPFVAPFRWVGRAMVACAGLILVAWSTVQVVRADQYLIRPQLSAQADGGLRYQYNPRVLEAARLIPRGAVLDRRDVPLAADARVVDKARADLARLRLSTRDACPDPTERCYPLGGTTFHLLGDARTRLNWSASNTSYVERDGEDDLRGFDDRAVAVRSKNGISRPAALRRDYRDVVPLVRHRWEPAHPDVVAILSRPKDLHLTIDARLQVQVSSILSRLAMGRGTERSAVVVLDAATGEVLASVSHPWPILGADATREAESPEALLDRARYGLYPPGSTFKLVTAAAALRRDPDLTRATFGCERLPGGRVGARIPGFGRPVRDDVKDQHPHGVLAMHDGLVRSCNAYFAQLAVQVGTTSLGRTAELAGIVFPTTGSPQRLRDTLPHAGYGQGDVLATPLRMARLAAALATDGQIRDTPIVREAPATDPRAFLSAESSRVIAGYMRDAVTDGTGRLLSGHAVPIAGKTGTAEVDGAASHAWFVGFAPAGPATRRIAFAVLLENAGYGGAGAAAVAGQVVTAASVLGLIK